MKGKFETITVGSLSELNSWLPNNMNKQFPPAKLV